MITENDKLYIPERYKKMSVSELRCEKEKIYAEIKQNKKNVVKKQQQTVIFKF